MKGSWIKASWSSRESKLSGTGHTPKHSLPPMVVWAWLGCRLLSNHKILPSLKVIYLAHSLAWWDSTRYMPPVHLASLALRKNIKNGHLNCSSLGGWKMVRHPWTSSNPGELYGPSALIVLITYGWKCKLLIQRVSGTNLGPLTGLCMNRPLVAGKVLQVPRLNRNIPPRPFSYLC